MNEMFDYKLLLEEEAKKNQVSCLQRNAERIHPWTNLIQIHCRKLQRFALLIEIARVINVYLAHKADTSSQIEKAEENVTKKVEEEEKG